jgi:hypothetical protein
MSTIYDFWENHVEITRSYISYRNRVIDVHLIHTFQVKGRKLLINTYKQNQMIPTMCIALKDKETALEAYKMMMSVMYPQKGAEKSFSQCDAMSYIIASIAVPMALLATLAMRTC